MKRSTLKVDDALLRRLKRRAADEGRSLQDLADQLIRQGLAAEDRLPFTLTLTGWSAELQSGADILDLDKLLDQLDGR